MKILSTVLMLLTLSASHSLFAHSDHDHDHGGNHYHHPVSEAGAKALALEAASSLSKSDAGLGFGQLPASWAKVPAKNVEIKKRGKGYYIISVLNEREKKILYVLMAADGEIYDVNFSGEFEGLKD